MAPLDSDQLAALRRLRAAFGPIEVLEDVVVRHRGELMALYDAKYKWLDKAPARGDVYQMVTYCEHLGLAEATLVYPGDPGARSIEVGNRRVHVVGLPEPAHSNEAATYLRREVTADLPLA